MMTHYLYKITVGGKSYIGVSKNVRDRLGHHCLLPTLLGVAIRLHGRDSVSLCVLACGHREYIYELEARAISAFKTRSPDGYNLSVGGSGGRDPLPSTIVKLAAAASKTHKGRKQSPEQIENRAAALRGKKRTPEQCARLSAARLGDKHAPEHVAKRVATRKAHGYKHSEETKAKIGVAHKGRVLGPLPESVCEKISATHKARGVGIGRDMSQLIELSADLRRGVPLSEEHRTNISKANTGRKATQEACINMARAQKLLHGTCDMELCICHKRHRATVDCAHWQRPQLEEDAHV